MNLVLNGLDTDKFVKHNQRKPFKLTVWPLSLMLLRPSAQIVLY